MKAPGLVLLAIALFFLSSCSSSEGRPEQTDSTPEVPSLANFRLLWQDPLTLDPAQAADGISTGIIVEIFSGLLTLGPGDQAGSLIPEVAESWSIDNGGTTYIFRLRENAVFQDGRPVTAEDVKFSLERALDPATQSPTASIFLNDILGAQGFIEGKTDEVTGLEVLDPRSIQVSLEAPRAYFLSKLTNPVAFLVDRSNVQEGPSWTQRPNGTGPFKLEKWTLGEELVLGRRACPINQVRFRISSIRAI